MQTFWEGGWQYKHIALLVESNEDIVIVIRYKLIPLYMFRQVVTCTHNTTDINCCIFNQARLKPIEFVGENYPYCPIVWIATKAGKSRLYFALFTWSELNSHKPYQSKSSSWALSTSDKNKWLVTSVGMKQFKLILSRLYNDQYWPDTMQ